MMTKEQRAKEKEQSDAARAKIVAELRPKFEAAGLARRSSAGSACGKRTASWSR